MRVYLARFKYKDFPMIEPWYKFGYTLERDAAERFKGDEYQPFEIKILGSIFISNPSFEKATELCKEVEGYLLKKFPKNFVLEEHLNMPFGTFNGLSGITEMFVLEEGVTQHDIVDLFMKVKDRVQANPKFNIK